MRKINRLIRILLLGVFIILFNPVRAEEETTQKLTLRTASLLKVPVNFPTDSSYDSGITIPYPRDGVKGIYVQSILEQKELNLIE